MSQPHQARGPSANAPQGAGGGAGQSSTPPLPTPSWFSRLLWFCAGADLRLLRLCPGSDWIKYQGIGGVVLATTVLAFASGTYGFYTVFSPKDETALSTRLDMQTTVLSIVAGLVWALVIFNIDRFIVSST